ncbi:hypothetical protein JB92DRAFT_2833740 [Gautieria morchelliformis]|nr:hypothetical protein JB92DRAFT_2833740 [Gautieria morchelliformis]
MQTQTKNWHSRRITCQAAKTKSTSHTSPGCPFAKSAFGSKTAAADKPPAPNQTAPRPLPRLSKMKEYLGDSAREALSKPHLLAKKLDPDPTEHHGTSELRMLMQGPPGHSAVPEIIVLDDDT